MTNEPGNINEKSNEAEGAELKPKKKNIIRIFRPQNSKTGMVRPEQRPGTAKRPAPPRDGQGRVRPAGEGQARPVRGPRPDQEGQARPARPARPAGEGQARPVRPRPERTAEGKPVRPVRPAAAESTVSGAPQIEPQTEPKSAPAAETVAAAPVKTEPAVREAEAATAAVKPAVPAAEEVKKPEPAAAPAAPTEEVKKPEEPKTPEEPAFVPGRIVRRASDVVLPVRTPAKKSADRPAGNRNGQRQNERQGQGSRPAGGAPSARPGSRDGGAGAERRGPGRGFAGNARPAAAPGRGPAPDTKPEKDGRSRNDRQRAGDKKNGRNEKGDKFDRMEQRAKSANAKTAGRTKPQAKPVKPAPKPVQEEEKIKSIVIPELITIKDLADKLKIQPAAIVKKLFMQGKMVTVNQEIDFAAAEEIAIDYDVICEQEVKVDVIEELLKEEDDAPETLTVRPPVVCVMGHVDHGKTSLLDAIRNTHVIDREAGGITQHIGASVVECNGQKITFLDTPGHEAFTSMRMRGANSTDIAILVVAADDGVMPQTVEAINHAKAAGIEIIVAINKIDKPGANIERVKQELTEYALIPEDWGGSTVFCEVSAKTHEGIDNLLEMILLTAEVLELKANPNRRARGIVIEAQLDKGRGPVATVLVQKGTLRVGDPVAAGSCYGRVRAMFDDKRRSIKEAGPSTPAEIIGFSGVPGAGEILVSPENEKEARSFAETFISEGREKLLEETKHRMSLDDLFSQIQAGNLKELNLIVKADVQGSVEAVKQSLLKLSNDEVVVKIIHSAVGAINESDATLASASNAIIIGFNVRPDAMAKATAEREGVDVRLYRVIYDAIADIEAAMKGMLDPIYEERITGHAEIRQVFRASGIGSIAGSYVLDGVFQRGCKARVTREGSLIFDGSIVSLKRFKDDVKEVKAGYECGIVFEKFNEIREGDQIEAYNMVEIPR